MKVLILGGPDGAAPAVGADALSAGHSVTSYDGDVLDQDAVDKALDGQDAVVCVSAAPSRRPTTVYSDAAAVAVAGMVGAGIRRIVVVSSLAVDPRGGGRGLLGAFYTALIIHRRYRNTLNDMERMEAEVTRTGLDWTVLRVGRGAATGRWVSAHLDDPASYRQTVELTG